MTSTVGSFGKRDQDAKGRSKGQNNKRHIHPCTYQKPTMPTLPPHPNKKKMQCVDGILLQNSCMEVMYRLAYYSGRVGLMRFEMQGLHGF